MAPSETDGKPTLREVTASEAADLLPELMSRAEYGGERTVIVRRGKRAAAIVSIADLEILMQGKRVA